MALGIALAAGRNIPGKWSESGGAITTGGLMATSLSVPRRKLCCTRSGRPRGWSSAAETPLPALTPSAVGSTPRETPERCRSSDPLYGSSGGKHEKTARSRDLAVFFERNVGETPRVRCRCAVPGVVCRA
jgi:hypothetical protein